MYAPPPSLIAVGVVLTGLMSAGALYAWPWSRQPRRVVVGALSAAVAFLVWRGALIFADGSNFDIDYQLLLGLSYEDIGSGVLAFAFATLAFGFGADRAEAAGRVVASAALVGAAAMFVDRFV